MTDALRDRILARVTERAMGYETPCWISDRYTRPNGYTTIGVNNRVTYTHRAAYIAFVGDIPDGMQLDHLCRNRACCNPDHLEPVSQHENILRGEGWAAKFADQTHCLRGHPLSGANLYVRRDTGGRQCRACNALRQRRYQGSPL